MRITVIFVVLLFLLGGIAYYFATDQQSGEYLTYKSEKGFQIDYPKDWVAYNMDGVLTGEIIFFPKDSLPQDGFVKGIRSPFETDYIKTQVISLVSSKFINSSYDQLKNHLPERLKRLKNDLSRYSKKLELIEKKISLDNPNPYTYLISIVDGDKTFFQADILAEGPTLTLFTIYYLARDGFYSQEIVDKLLSSFSENIAEIKN